MPNSLIRVTRICIRCGAATGQRGRQELSKRLARSLGSAQGKLQPVVQWKPFAVLWHSIVLASRAYTTWLAGWLGQGFDVPHVPHCSIASLMTPR
jgi:hypothetical protein